MLCKNCGKRIGKSAAFCSGCGAKIEKSEIITTDKTPCRVKTTFGKFLDKFKQKKVWILTASIVIFILVVGLLVWRFFANRVNVADYIEINDATGLSGYASLDYEFDYVKLARDLNLDDIRDIKELKELEEDGIFRWGMKTSELRNIERVYDLDLDDFIELYKSVNIKIDNDGRIKNGDKAKLEIEVYDDGEFDKRLVGGELYFKVEDLDDAIELDLFENTEIKFSGENGQGSVTFIKDDSEVWRNSVVYTYSNVGKLSNGDDVTITATVNNYEYNKEKLEKEGKHLPKTAQKKVTVEGLSAYAKFEDINDKIIDKAFDLMRTVCISSSNTDVKPSGVYYIQSTENSTSYYMEARNALIINLSSVEYSDWGSHVKNTVCILPNITKEENGVLGFSKEPAVLFSATGLNEIEIVSRLNEYYKGFEIIAVK